MLSTIARLWRRHRLLTIAFAVAIADDFELTEYGTVNLKDGSICAAFQLLSERVG